jgi:hypothetical protein
MDADVTNILLSGFTFASLADVAKRERRGDLSAIIPRLRKSALREISVCVLSVYSKLSGSR